jgi:hypothetical protein
MKSASSSFHSGYPFGSLCHKESFRMYSGMLLDADMSCSHRCLQASYLCSSLADAEADIARGIFA